MSEGLAFFICYLRPLRKDKKSKSWKTLPTASLGKMKQLAGLDSYDA